MESPIFSETQRAKAIIKDGRELFLKQCAFLRLHEADSMRYDLTFR